MSYDSPTARSPAPCLRCLNTRPRREWLGIPGSKFPNASSARQAAHLSILPPGRHSDIPASEADAARPMTPRPVQHGSGVTGLPISPTCNVLSDVVRTRAVCNWLFDGLSL